MSHDSTSNSNTAGRFSRRTIFGMASSGIIAAAGISLTAGEAEATSLNSRDRDILNFALNLEYLEAEFYLIATQGTRLPQDQITGTGTAGATTGGRQVTFTDQLLSATANEITTDEVDHVKLIRSVLGRQAVAKPAINLEALGIGFANENEFLLLSRAFEDTGVSAYSGAAPLFSSSRSGRTILGAAARILAAEAYHAGNIRLQVIQRGLASPPVDAMDIAPDAAHFFDVDQTSGLAVARTTGQVINIVKPFFPQGINGRIQR